MKVKELIKELEKFDSELEVKFEYSYLKCSGHGPHEYCYCPYEDERRNVTYILKEENSEYSGKKLKVPEVVIKGD